MRKKKDEVEVVEAKEEKKEAAPKKEVEPKKEEKPFVRHWLYNEKGEGKLINTPEDLKKVPAEFKYDNPAEKAK